MSPNIMAVNILFILYAQSKCFGSSVCVCSVCVRLCVCLIFAYLHSMNVAWLFGPHQLVPAFPLTQTRTLTHNPPLLGIQPGVVVHVGQCRSMEGWYQWRLSDSVLHLAVVVACVWRVLLIEEKKRRLVRAVLRRGGVCSQVRNGGVTDGGGRRLIHTNSVVAALGGLRRAVQARCHQAVLVLSSCDLKKWGIMRIVIILNMLANTCTVVFLAVTEYF